MKCVDVEGMYSYMCAYILIIIFLSGKSQWNTVIENFHDISFYPNNFVFFALVVEEMMINSLNH